MSRDLYKLLGITALLIGALVAAAKLHRGAEQVERAERVAERARSDESIFVRPHSRFLGPKDAKVTVVEFLDPECESCRAIHPMIKDLLGRYDGRIRLVVRYMPFHRNSVYAAGALEAAGEQGLYWEMLEMLFTNQPAWGDHHHPRPELIPGYAQQVGLDMQAFEAYLQRGEHRAMVEADQADGRSLGVKGTPSFFVNGRPLEQLGLAQLKALIDEELAK